MAKALHNLKIYDGESVEANTNSKPVNCASLVLGSDTSDMSSMSWLIDRTRVIGRASADIELQVSALSRLHAEVSFVNMACQIQDLDSRNGTAINGQLISNEPHILNDGDSIVLAGEVELKFHDPNATPFAPSLGALRGLWIDPNTSDVWIDAQRLSPALSHKQFVFLRLIADANGELVTRDMIASHVWPKASPNYLNNDAIDSLIKRLRKRLSSIERRQPVLEIVRGRGIRLNSQQS